MKRNNLPSATSYWPSRVSGKGPEAEASDPSTTPQRLAELALSHGELVAQNPNTPPSVLAALSVLFPTQVKANPVYGMFLLERAEHGVFWQNMLSNLKACLEDDLGFAVRDVARTFDTENVSPWFSKKYGEPMEITIEGFNPESIKETVEYVWVETPISAKDLSRLVADIKKEYDHLETLIQKAEPHLRSALRCLSEDRMDRVIEEIYAADAAFEGYTTIESVYFAEKLQRDARDRLQELATSGQVGAAPRYRYLFERLHHVFLNLPKNANPDDPNLIFDMFALDALPDYPGVTVEQLKSAMDLQHPPMEMMAIVKMIVFIACSMRPTITLFQPKKAAVALVNNTQVTYMPDACPRILKSPGIIQMRSPEKGDRLYASIISIAWAPIEKDGIGLIAELDDGQGHTNFVYFPWTPKWDGTNFREDQDLLDNIDKDHAHKEEMSELSKRIVRFLTTFAILVMAENSPMRLENEIHRGKGSGKGSSTPTNWVTRHVFLAEQYAKRIERPSQEDIETARREGLELEDVVVKGHLKRVRFGPGFSQVKQIWIEGYASHRWISPNKHKKIIVH